MKIIATHEANDKADRALHASSSQQCCSSLQSGELCPLADELEHLGIPGLHPYVNLVASSSSHCVRQPRIHLVCPCVAEPREPELPLHHALTKRLSPPRNGREHVVDKRHLLYAFFLHKPLQLIQHILHSPPSHLTVQYSGCGCPRFRSGGVSCWVEGFVPHDTHTRTVAAVGVFLVSQLAGSRFNK